MKTYHSHSIGTLLPGLALLALSSVSTPASCVRDSSFNPGGSFTGGTTVMAAAVQSDGKAIFGGYFTYNGNYPNGYPFSANNLVRFNTDGTVDTGFNPSPNGIVRAIVIQPDQKILIGGHFTQVAGLTQTYISRLNPGGGPDYIGFQAAVPNNYVYALGRISDGRV
ncbi:MAG TPA: delta-60 repeat domain-containing protein, partial [Candidatus Binatia bacterium]|nr:delta-60 repeat domain-containing protein [Candidatus Binatia bacterium]